MIGVEVSKAAVAPTATAELEQGGILSEFTLSGAIRGRASVCYSITLARWIAAQMLQCDEHCPEQDVLDAAGEVANMIVGNVKNKLENYVGTIQISTPAVEKLDRLEQATRNPAASAVTFRCRESVFAVAIAFREASELPDKTKPDLPADTLSGPSPAPNPPQSF
jgi:CheY-specific phosphatase CheX